MKNFNKIETIGILMYLVGACFLGGDEILKPLLFLMGLEDVIQFFLR